VVAALEDELVALRATGGLAPRRVATSSRAGTRGRAPSTNTAVTRRADRSALEAMNAHPLQAPLDAAAAEAMRSHPPLARHRTWVRQRMSAAA
jgi:hypothetical protein